MAKADLDLKDSVVPPLSPTTYSRFIDLKQRRIVNNRVTLQNWIDKQGFPAGVLIGNSRLYPDDEVEAWLKSRATAPKVNPTPKSKRAAADAGADV